MEEESNIDPKRLPVLYNKARPERYKEEYFAGIDFATGTAIGVTFFYRNGELVKIETIKQNNNGSISKNAEKASEEAKRTR